MEFKESTQTLLQDKLTRKIIKILLTTFKLEENFLELSQNLKTSRPTLKNRIDLLEEHEIIIRDKTKVHLSTDIEIFQLLNTTIPVDQTSKNASMESLQREMVYHYIVRHKDTNNFFKPRPTDNFDIREAIQPSISISNKLEITEASESFYELFKDDVPHAREKRLLLSFFKNVNIYLYDSKTDIIKNELLYTKLYKELLNNGNVHIEACYIKESGEKVFLSIFANIQTNFLGMQSIINNITERVKIQRIRKRLTHRFYHLISVVDSIGEQLKELDIDNKKFKFLTNQLNMLSSFDYLENIYAANTEPLIEPYRDFKLNRNLKSIIEQLKFLYQIPKSKLIYHKSEYPIKVPNCYDIYFYEGLYLLIENLILKSNHECDCTIHAYKRNKIIFIESFFSEPINHEIEVFIKSLKNEIIKNSCINQNHLHLKIFLDELSKEAILELVVSSYFDEITIGDDSKSILFKLKDTSCDREINDEHEII